MHWLKRNWLYLSYVAINMAIAAPADAGLSNEICYDEQGGQYGCCSTCLIFCRCDYL